MEAGLDHRSAFPSRRLASPQPIAAASEISQHPLGRGGTDRGARLQVRTCLTQQSLGDCPLRSDGDQSPPPVRHCKFPTSWMSTLLIPNLRRHEPRIASQHPCLENLGFHEIQTCRSLDLMIKHPEAFYKVQGYRRLKLLKSKLPMPLFRDIQSSGSPYFMKSKLPEVLIA